DKFNTVKQAEKFTQSGGKIYACGSCIKSRDQKDSEMCPLSTMKDMYEIIKESDKIITF
ncbi:MAG: DsrE family protein, partial [Elusimicrobiales bacterium]|nr:DsrE family protein [Elusimicrobiales bacterium]